MSQGPSAVAFMLLAAYAANAQECSCIPKQGGKLEDQPTKIWGMLAATDNPCALRSGGNSTADECVYRAPSGTQMVSTDGLDFLQFFHIDVKSPLIAQKTSPLVLHVPPSVEGDRSVVYHSTVEKGQVRVRSTNLGTQTRWEAPKTVDPRFSILQVYRHAEQGEGAVLLPVRLGDNKFEPRDGPYKVVLRYDYEFSYARVYARRATAGSPWQEIATSLNPLTPEQLQQALASGTTPISHPPRTAEPTTLSRSASKQKGATKETAIKKAAPGETATRDSAPVEGPGVVPVYFQLPSKETGIWEVVVQLLNGKKQEIRCRAFRFRNDWQ